MSCPFSLKSVKFRETAHIAFEDEYVTAYQSTDIVPKIYKNAKLAYADLIDHISGKGTWASNPYVFVYEFELIK